jgi:hypothetical protein
MLILSKEDLYRLWILSRAGMDSLEGFNYEQKIQQEDAELTRKLEILWRLGKSAKFSIEQISESEHRPTT